MIQVPYASYSMIQVPYASYKVVAALKKAFKLNAININIKCTNTHHLVQKMPINAVSSLNWMEYLPSTDHFFQISAAFEDDEVTLIINKLCHEYLTMRLHTCGELYT